MPYCVRVCTDVTKLYPSTIRKNLCSSYPGRKFTKTCAFRGREVALLQSRLFSV